MTKRDYIIAVLALLVIVLIIRQYVATKVQVATYQQVKQDTKQDVKQIEDKIADRNAQVGKAKSSTEQKKREVATSEDVRRELESDPDLLPPELSKAIESEPLPDAPSFVKLPESAFKSVFDFGEDCKLCKARVAAALATIDDQQEIISKKDAQIKAAENAIKGGSRWQRLGKAIKVIGCAGSGAALGSVAGVKGAAIGGAGGATLCTLF